MENHSAHQHNKMKSNHYGKLLIMAVLSFISMYILMYSMVDGWSNVVPNVNQFYMAGVMAMPMVIIEILLMKQMYNNAILNAIIITVSLVLLIAFFMSIRKQTAIGDRQFLKSMIPHHAGAVLMVEEADLNDPEIRELAKGIIESQQKEIDFMKKKLEELK